ncbi:MAG: translesion DNA synthesis-associated protein ImuA [Comamonadaceae bacterium]|nr:MAG: translesion DNA synthesis-associated protein ImuA [Comamonadaceae bacterium]
MSHPSPSSRAAAAWPGAHAIDLGALRERGVWRADELEASGEAVCATGHAALDAELPGGGWPQGALTELLQPDPMKPLWPLLLPTLARTVAQRPSVRVVLVAPPLPPFGPALAAGGLPAASLLCVRAEGAAERLWVSEQALRCADVGAVLVWLPQSRTADLRRLQLAAARQGGLLFAMRPATQASQASPARLRLSLELLPAEADAPIQLWLHLIKRRGPPAAHPVLVPAQGAALEALLAAARARRRAVPLPGAEVGAQASPAAGARVLPWPRGRAALQAATTSGPGHALDRTALVPV